MAVTVITPGGRHGPTETRDAEAGRAGPDTETRGISDGALAATGPEHLYLTHLGLALIAVGSALLLVQRRKSAEHVSVTRSRMLTRRRVVDEGRRSTYAC